MTTYAGGVLCRGCNITAARWRIALPASRVLLRCQWCAARLKGRHPRAVVEALPERTAQLALPVGGER